MPTAGVRDAYLQTVLTIRLPRQPCYNGFSVEPSGLEPLTSWVRSRRSPN